MNMKADDTLADVPCSAESEEPAILQEIEIEDLAVDGICGVY